MSVHSTKNATKTTSPTPNSMATKLIRLAVGAGAGLALTVMAAPASADVKPEPSPVVQTVDDDGLEATSIALGAFGGIALAGAGLGVTLGVQRRRDHTAIRPA
ncbi:hypothetical protein EV643_115116 [Kribbella sp. VKM Ac-2527]|uniref:LPXTG-motif cell wall-anchored protein n=1 Tax=Kribbella caucasensis TaxID=2512215 RepID=A0A4R6K5F1_9ACTN|nr:hypothetical protein [Kribbella sp. VKM Ac-2527]TDO44616.1 hypothetical protein EV643_115116 [Kribbella sp. VKM Ac-2527]